MCAGELRACKPCRSFGAALGQEPAGGLPASWLRSEILCPYLEDQPFEDGHGTGLPEIGHGG